jgi:multiple sugar transport system substrate-binding protein
MKKGLSFLFISMIVITFALFPLVGAREAGAEVSEFGDFSGVTLNAKLIGGAMYEPLYTRIPIWEQKTGAKVVILSKKNHFDLDREIKQDIAAQTLGWDVGSNHSSFAAQYGNIYIDLKEYLSKEQLAPFVPRSIENCTVEGKLVQMPRHGDVSNVYYQKHLYEDEDRKKAFKEKHGYDLKPPDTWDEFKDQAIFFSDPPNFYGTTYVGKDEAIAGRYMEMLYCYGGKLFDSNWKPVFNSPEGVAALQWFVDLYNAKAVPQGVLNYLWGDTGMGFASGTIALNLDWAGWAGYFNNPEQSKVAGDLGIIRGPKGPGGKRTGWSGWHTFSVTQQSKNKEAATSLVHFLTNYESQMHEARTGLLPSRTQVWDDVVTELQGKGDTFLADVFTLWKQTMLEDAYTPPLIPEWVPFTNILFPELQAAIVGDKTSQQALDDAAVGADALMREAGYY